jgi:hypothetical protein
MYASDAGPPQRAEMCASSGNEAGLHGPGDLGFDTNVTGGIQSIIARTTPSEITTIACTVIARMTPSYDL